MGPPSVAPNWLRLKGGHLGAIEVVAGIHDAVAQELVCRAVEVITACTGDGVNHSAGRFSIIGGGVSCNDGELLDRVGSQHRTQNVPGSATGEVVNAYTVQPVIVLLRAAATDRHLRTPTTIFPAVTSCRDRRLGLQWCGRPVRARQAASSRGPLRGRSRTVCPPTTSLKVEDASPTPCDSAVTSTEFSTTPRFSWKSTVSCCPTSTSRFLFTKSPNPVCAAEAL